MLQSALIQEREGRATGWIYVPRKVVREGYYHGSIPLLRGEKCFLVLQDGVNTDDVVADLADFIHQLKRAGSNRTQYIVEIREAKIDYTS